MQRTRTMKSADEVNPPLSDTPFPNCKAKGLEGSAVVGFDPGDTEESVLGNVGPDVGAHVADPPSTSRLAVGEVVGARDKSVGAVSGAAEAGNRERRSAGVDVPVRRLSVGPTVGIPVGRDESIGAEVGKTVG